MPPEDGLAPSLSPDERGRQGCPVLHHLIRPDLHIGFEDRSLADFTMIAHQGPLKKGSECLDLAALADHILPQRGALADINPIPDNRIGNGGACFNNAVVPYDRVDDPGFWAHLGAFSNQDGALKGCGKINPAVLIQPDLPVGPLQPSPGKLHLYLSGEDIAMGDSVFQEVPNIPPIARSGVSIKGHPFLQEA